MLEVNSKETFVKTFVLLKNAYRQKKNSSCNKHLSLILACLKVCDLMSLLVQLEDDVEY